MKDKSQLIIYSIFAIIALIVIFGLTNRVLSLSKENNLLKQGFIEYRDICDIRINSINQLRTELSQSWNGSLICLNETDRSDLVPC